MPPKGRSKKSKAIEEVPVVEPTPAPAPAPEPAPAPAPEPAPEPAPAPTPAPEPAPAHVPATKAKKPKKQPKVVAVVTPDGIQGSFLPEPRRPLIAHLKINSTEVQFHETPLFYDPKPPGQPEPYDAQADDVFGKHNEEIVEKKENVSEPVVVETPKEVKQEEKLATGLDAFTKYELMVQYKEHKSTSKIPETTNIACFWCAHTFSWQPTIIPEREEKGIYRVYGNFCCPNCSMAYLLQESLDTHVRWERIALLHRMYGALYPSRRIFPSPARESLKLFGGPMTIQEYRASVATGRIRVDIQMPPMVSILGSIDTKPIDFYDSSMKHTVSPLLGEIVPKAEEGLRLKRSKPLKEKDSTLDSVLKIQIKSKL